MVEDSKFSNTILTNIGHQMLTSISNGNRKITYTKAEAYAQDVSSISNETLQALTSLQGKKLSANLLVSNDSGNVVTITANFRNKGLTNDVVFNSIGWFAKLDTDDAERGITANQEYLIGITPASGTQTLVAPPADQSSSQAISINLNMTLSDASNVNMTVNDAGAVHFNQLDDQLAKYTTTADLNKLLAGKADVGSSYTKAEIDAKLLDLTTDTDGKVSADQVQALISDKANISDVYSKSQVDSALSTRDTEISTKANISDVYTKSQVDSALSTRDTQISTKANISDVYTKSDVDNAFTDVRGRLGKLEGTQTLDSPDFNSITTTGVYYITNNTPANIKNNPSSQWGVLVVSNGNGNRTSQVYYPDDGSPQWCRLLNGSNWLPWYQLSTKKDISNAINKFDLSKVKFRKQYINGDGDKVDKTWSATKNDDGTYTIDLYNDDWTASKLHDVLTQLPNKADTSTVNAQIADAKNTIKSDIDNLHNDLQNQVNANNQGTFTTGYDWNTATPTIQSRTLQNARIVDQQVLRGAVDRMNDINSNANGRLSLGGGNMNLRSTINWNGGEINDKTGCLGGLYWSGGTDSAAIFADQNANDNLDLVFKLGDDDSNHFSFRNAAGQEKAAIWANGQINSPTIQDLYNKLAQYTVDYNNNYVHDTTIDFNSYLHETRTIKVANVKANNGPLPNTVTIWGWLTTYHWDDNSVTQEYRDAGGEVFWRATNASASRPWTWHKLATYNDITDLQNQIQQLRDNQFEVQTFTDATAAANWEAQKPGKRMAIVNS